MKISKIKISEDSKILDLDESYLPNLLLQPYGTAVPLYLVLYRRLFLLKD